MPFKHPFPPPDAFWSTAKALLTQFWTAAVVPPGWFSLIATLLGVLGIAYALRDRRWMLGALLASLALCFIPIGRNLTTDGLVGSRYFQAAIPVALTLSGLGFAAVCDLLTGVLQLRESVLGRHATRWVPAVLGVALTAGAWLEGRRAMAYRYAFQDEYSFLRDATSRLEDGCTVLQLPLRRDGFERDLDCCLDAPRSPLVIANPGLRWRYFEPGRGVPADSNTCVVYYEGAACSLADITITRERNPEALRWFRHSCPSVLDVLSARPLEESGVSPESTTGILGNERVRVRLYWVRGDAR